MAVRRGREESGPVVIGATGGSGTRVIARIAMDAGVFLGENRNEAEDSRDVDGFFERWINAHLEHQKSTLWPVTRMVLWARMAPDLRRRLSVHLAPLGSAEVPWGWKCPRSIYLLPFLASQFPGLRFIHVVRDGRDMAFSNNVRQLVKHGGAVLGPEAKALTQPARAIRLWSWLNLTAADYGEAHLGARYHVIRIEDLCAAPAAATECVLTFLRVSGNAGALAQRHVATPDSLARWRAQDPEVVAELERMARPALCRFGYL